MNWVWGRRRGSFVSRTTRTPLFPISDKAVQAPYHARAHAPVDATDSALAATLCWSIMSVSSWISSPRMYSITSSKVTIPREA